MKKSINKIPLIGLIKNSSRALDIQNTVKSLANRFRRDFLGNTSFPMSRTEYYDIWLNGIIFNYDKVIAEDFKQLIIRESLK